MVTAAPDGADGVDDIAGRQAVAPGDFRLAGRAAVQRAALFQQIGTGRAMDGTIDAAAAQQRFIGGVDDGVQSQRGDVDLTDFDTVHDSYPLTPAEDRQRDQRGQHD